MSRSPLTRLPEITELLTFVTAADEGSIRRASVRLHVSPAAVAKRLDNLEAVVGGTLLTRGPRGLELTPAGRDFYQRAARLVAEAQALTTSQPTQHPTTLARIHELLGRSSLRPVPAMLADAERLLASLLEMASEGVIVMSLPERTFLEVNAAYCRMLGYRRDDLLGSSAPALGLWMDDDARDRFCRELASKWRTGPGEHLLRTASGEPRVFVVEARQIELGGREVLVATMSEPSAERWLEQPARAECA